jgi:hypothetical protein
MSMTTDEQREFADWMEECRRADAAEDQRRDAEDEARQAIEDDWREARDEAERERIAARLLQSVDLDEQMWLDHQDRDDTAQIHPAPYNLDELTDPDDVPFN